MISEIHFLRPLWFLALIPLLLLAWMLWRQNLTAFAWGEVCDHYLLPHLMSEKGQSKRKASLVLLFLSGLFMIISMAGPTWSRYPVPSFKEV